jgi:hypothetical protein
MGRGMVEVGARPAHRGTSVHRPGFDCNSANNGQSGPVWFLALSSAETPLAERNCTASIVLISHAWCRLQRLNWRTP